MCACLTIMMIIVVVAHLITVIGMIDDHAAVRIVKANCLAHAVSVRGPFHLVVFSSSPCNFFAECDM